MRSWMIQMCGSIYMSVEPTETGILCNVQCATDTFSIAKRREFEKPKKF